MTPATGATRRRSAGTYQASFCRRAAAAILALAGLALAGGAHAYKSVNSGVATPASPKRAAAAPRAAPSRMSAPVVSVNGTAPGQAGYVHYFVITGPDGEAETQIGLELPGDRVAWSFPNMGVTISPFIASGHVIANGEPYEVEYLYGIRPFPDEASMSLLRRNLETRVSWWVGQKAPYCDEENPSHELCVSCLGFVLRVLYPAETPSSHALPSDFLGARKDVYTTEDFLMYLAGVRVNASRQSRLKRIKALKVPPHLRQELVRIATAPGAKPIRTASARPRASARPPLQSQKRPASRRRS
jgi:hypothetical protein